MKWLKNTISDMTIPDVENEVRSEYVVHAAFQLQKQARILFVFLLLTTPLAIWAAAPGAPWLVAWGLPILMGAYCLFGIIQLSRKIPFSEKPRAAARFLVDSSISSCFGAVVCSLWCVLSWVYAPADERLQFAMILMAGAFATAYCLASVRFGAIANLVIDIAPISLMMMSFGSPMDFAAGFSLIIACIFQVRMINAHHQHVVALLESREQVRILARTDPLTNLLNRRALLNFAKELGDSQTLSRLMLIDIDHFKTINDAHGHDMGDEVLVAIARVLQLRAGEKVSASRIGGEEFALLGAADDLPEAIALALLADIRALISPHGGKVTASIGIAEAVPTGDHGWSVLCGKADTALYHAKNSGRNRHVHARDAGVPRPEVATSFQRAADA